MWTSFHICKKRLFSIQKLADIRFDSLLALFDSIIIQLPQRWRTCNNLRAHICRFTAQIQLKILSVRKGYRWFLHDNDTPHTSSKFEFSFSWANSQMLASRTLVYLESAYSTRISACEKCIIMLESQLLALAFEQNCVVAAKLLKMSKLIDYIYQNPYFQSPFVIRRWFEKNEAPLQWRFVINKNQCLYIGNSMNEAYV